MCARSADSCLTLGMELQTADPAAAERAYARAVDKALDRGRLLLVDWLVNRYHDTGRADEAMKVARMAADTYSGPGPRGRWPDTWSGSSATTKRAEYYQRIAERYDDLMAVDAFFAKNRGRLDERKHGARVAEAMARLFPEGVKKVTLAELPGPPEGAIVGQTTPAAAWACRRPIVALDGYRLRNHHQYGAIKGWSADPKMRLIVHDGRGYKEVEGERARIVYFRSIAPGIDTKPRRPLAAARRHRSYTPPIMSDGGLGQGPVIDIWADGRRSGCQTFRARPPPSCASRSSASRRCYSC